MTKKRRLFHTSKETQALRPYKIILTFSFLLIFAGVAAAEPLTVFVDYSKEEDYDEYGLKMGLDWKISDRWGLAFNQLFAEDGGNGDVTYGQVRYLLPKQHMMLAVHYEEGKFKDSKGLLLNTFLPIKEGLWFDGSFSYTAYTSMSDEPGNTDYGLVKFISGIQYQINSKNLLLVNSEWLNASYKQSPIDPNVNPDYQEYWLSAGLLHQINEAWQIKGIYTWIYTRCDDQDIDEIWGGSTDKFTLFLDYYRGKHHFYLEYPFPKEGNLVKVGVSYRFS